MAVTELSRAIELEPENHLWYQFRALYYEMLQKTQEANADYRKEIECLTKKLQANPESFSCYYSRGSAYGNLGEHDSAIADYSKLIEVTGSDDDYGARAKQYAAIGQFDKALSDYSKAIELDTEGKSLWWLERAKFFVDRQEYTRALQDFDQAAQKSPADHVIWILKAKVKQKMNDFDLALADLNHAIELSDYCVCDRGIAYLENGDIEKAIADFDQAISRDEGFSNAYLHRAKAYKKSGNMFQAQLDYDKAKELYPHLQEVL